MKLFECSSGSLINPLLVTFCEISYKDGQYSAMFCFAGGGYKHAKRTTRPDAEEEIKRYKEHFETEMKL